MKIGCICVFFSYGQLFDYGELSLCSMSLKKKSFQILFGEREELGGCCFRLVTHLGPGPRGISRVPITKFFDDKGNINLDNPQPIHNLKMARSLVFLSDKGEMMVIIG
jgi:hypothetical protein